MDPLLLTKVLHLRTFPSFLPNVPFLFWDPIQDYHITFGCHVASDSSWLCQFLRLPWFLETLTIWRKTGILWNIFILGCRCLDMCLMFSSWLD